MNSSGKVRWSSRLLIYGTHISFNMKWLKSYLPDGTNVSYMCFVANKLTQTLIMFVLVHKLNLVPITNKWEPNRTPDTHKTLIQLWLQLNLMILLGSWFLRLGDTVSCTPLDHRVENPSQPKGSQVTELRVFMLLFVEETLAARVGEVGQILPKRLKKNVCVWDHTLIIDKESVLVSRVHYHTPKIL